MAVQSCLNSKIHEEKNINLRNSTGTKKDKKRGIAFKKDGAEKKNGQTKLRERERQRQKSDQGEVDDVIMIKV